MQAMIVQSHQSPGLLHMGKHRSAGSYLQDTAGSVGGHEPHKGASGCCEGDGVDCNKVKLLSEALSPLRHLPDKGRANGESFLNRQLMDKGWICHHPAHNVTCELHSTIPRLTTFARILIVCKLISGCTCKTPAQMCHASPAQVQTDTSQHGLEVVRQCKAYLWRE